MVTVTIASFRFLDVNASVDRLDLDLVTAAAALVEDGADRVITRKTSGVDNTHSGLRHPKQPGDTFSGNSFAAG